MRVLIVDDDEAICLMLEAIFKKKGWETSTALSGKSALEMMQKGNFDVVFLDILMPEMDGMEVLKKMRSQPKLENISVIFVTAKELSQKDRAELIGLGAQGIYRKPVDPLSVVESALQHVRRS